MAQALRAQIEAGGVDPDVAAFYRARAFRPLWAPGRLRLDVDRLAARLGVDATAQHDDPWRLAEIELALSTAYAVQATELETDRPERLAYIDPALAPKRKGKREALETAAQAPSVADLVEAESGARNPIYEDLARALERYRLQWAGLPDIRIAAGRDLGPGATGVRVDQLRARLGLPETGRPFDGALEHAVRAFQRAHGLQPTGRADAATLAALNAGPAHYERLIEANLHRAEALPASFGERFIMVDAAAGQLWFYEKGQELAAMKVVTGKPSQPTPIMAGMIRHLIFNPYWNVPEDLVRTSIAPKVLEHGLKYVEDEGLEVLADYSDGAPVLDPASVDWKAVEAGTLSVRVRQRPGPKNMMGKVKLMLPNPLGIYLHDTPHKGDFAKSERLASSGCVRLEDAMRLARLLVGETAAEAAVAVGGEEKRVDLVEPVPVYITYFTAIPTEEGLVFRPDVYGRDKAWDAQHAAGSFTTPTAGGQDG
ncbi:L,D-transpeptidase family protein [Phenylobacterium sp.]|uniref:L,D-transpeptidase family protein n=1 Tax=Phenylobacterium sp. TaxID=1871053 RepID=UPI002810BAA4|nr:L,D-transpeptidase family protein [Phenylobacterium sp.]